MADRVRRGLAPPVRIAGFSTEAVGPGAVPSTDDAEAGRVARRLPISVPPAVRAGAVGLLAGVAGGAVATLVDPAGTLATGALLALVVGAVTLGWLRWRRTD